MSFSQSDITALESAIKSGVRRVKYADREAEYHSLAEMQSLLAQMRAEVNGSVGGAVIFAGRIE